MATVLGMVAEMERKFILERQRAGIDAAKARGVYKGRKPSIDAAAVKRLVEREGLGALGTHLIMGERLREMQINSARNQEAGLGRTIEALVRKPV